MEQRPESRRASIEMVVAMVLSGSIGVFVIESEQSAFNVVFFRCLIASMCLLPYCYFKGFLRSTYFTAKNLTLILAGGACLVFNWVFFFESYALTSISLATIVYHVNPFIILGLGALFFRSKIGPWDVFWTLVAFAGLFFVVNPGLSANANFSDHLRGLTFVLIATTLYSFTVILTKKVSFIPSPVIILLQASLGTLILLPFASLREVPLVGDHWVYLASLGVVHTFFLYSVLYSAYQKLSIVMIAILSFIYPLSTVLFDFVFYDRVLGFGQFFGFALIGFATLGVRLKWQPSLSPLKQIGSQNPRRR